MLNGDAGGVDHAFSSAAMLFDLRKKRKYVPIIQAVQGHHGGLETFDKQALEKAVRDPDFDECPSGKTASLRGKAEYETALKAFKSDFPSFTSFPKLPQRDASARGTADMLDTRMLFSTATQPDYTVIGGVPWQPTEIVPDSARLFSEMRRVSTEWRLYKNEARKDLPTLNDIADEMRSETNVCCIVNLRCHAKQLTKTLSSCDGVYLLSSDLCPAHRLKTVAEIKARQERKEPCRVVATQCIEAGVDLDFDVMYRSLAPMEAIVQAAGRCNRNGKLPHGGRLIVFEPNEDGKLYPKGNAYEDGAMAVKLLQSADGNLDPSDPERIKSYYKIFFAKNRDRRQLNNAIAEENYKKVAKEYRLIDNEGIRIIVPYDGEAELFREIKAANEDTRISMALLAKAAPHHGFNF